MSPYQNVVKNNLGLSDKKGTLQFNNYGLGAGMNSFVESQSFPLGYDKVIEEAYVTTAKAYIDQEALDQIDFMKIDVEGWEYFVLKGLGEYLNPDFVSVIQFEYGYSNGDSKTLMRDFYDLLEGKGYKVGKLRKNKVEFSDFVYHLNNFESGPNFIACHPDYVEKLSRF